MKTHHPVVAATALIAATAAFAHPLNETYASRGECEVAYAESSKEDRERLVGLGIFPNNGAAQSGFRLLFTCEYDEDADVWFIQLHQPPLDRGNQ